MGQNIPVDQLPSIFMDMRNAMTIVDMNNLSSIQPSKGMVINIPNIYFDVARSSLRNDSKTFDTCFQFLKESKYYNKFKVIPIIEVRMRITNCYLKNVLKVV